MHWKRDCPTCSSGGFLSFTPKKCDGCQGKGGNGTFGPCEVDNMHFKSLCLKCNGKCFI